MSPVLNDQALFQRLSSRADLGTFEASIGSTNATKGECLIDAESITDEATNESSDKEDDDILDKLHESVTKGT